jgi:hypothetical protein
LSETLDEVESGHEILRVDDVDRSLSVRVSPKLIEREKRVQRRLEVRSRSESFKLRAIFDNCGSVEVEGSIERRGEEGNVFDERRGRRVDRGEGVENRFVEYGVGVVGRRGEHVRDQRNNFVSNGITAENELNRRSRESDDRTLCQGRERVTRREEESTET